jgi:pimeloyl-ACP methyl ester carboxylesterase
MAARPETKLVRLADGRVLAWVELGAATGVPVMAFHGSPGSGWGFSPFHSTAADGGVRLIAVDRPGYGTSTHHPARRLADFPADVEQLADHLGLDRFAVIGHSAGGPHALACARFLPDRLLGCGVLSGFAPQSRTALTDGMMLTNRIQTAVYRHWPRRLDGVAAGLWRLALPLMVPLFRLGRRHRDRDVDRMLRRMLPACDLAVVSRPEIRQILVEEAAAFNSATVRTSVQDMAICIREWGFGLEDIDTPVHVWHGELDRNIPVAHARALAATIPNPTLHLCPGEGHWLLADHMAQVLHLVASGPRP